MDETTNRIEQTVPTIKERLMQRLRTAKEIVGQGWKEELAKQDPFFDSRMGAKYMDTAAQAISNNSRGSVDRIAKVTLALEAIAGIEPTPII